MDFAPPADLSQYLAGLDAFIDSEIKPLMQENDNIRFFDHRRQYARKDGAAGGVPTKDREELLAEARWRLVSALLCEGSCGG